MFPDAEVGHFVMQIVTSTQIAIGMSNMYIYLCAIYTHVTCIYSMQVVAILAWHMSVVVVRELCTHVYAYMTHTWHAIWVAQHISAHFTFVTNLRYTRIWHALRFADLHIYAHIWLLTFAIWHLHMSVVVVGCNLSTHVTYMTHIWHAQHIVCNLRFVTNLRYTWFDVQLDAKCK